ncbi:MAG: universal stress protein [Parvibaculum sp.]
MIIEEKKILACVDQSRFADFVTDYAVWAARRLDAPLELLHVINRHPETTTHVDHSGAIGFDAQEALLTELTDEDSERSRSAREEGRLILTRLRERALTAGVTADIRQRYGTLNETVTEQEDQIRLFVLGRRGQSAKTNQRDAGPHSLGRHVEEVVSSLSKPILTVTDSFKEPKRIMLAFDGGSVTRRGVRLMAGSPLFKGLPIHLLMSGKAGSAAERQLDWAKEMLEKAGFETKASFKPGDAETVITNNILGEDIDLLVMGAYSHVPWRRMLMGSKTTDLLRAAKVPTLLVR